MNKFKTPLGLKVGGATKLSVSGPGHEINVHVSSVKTDVCTRMCM